MVLKEGLQAGLVSHLNSQNLALACQRLAHFDEEYPVTTVDDFIPVMQHVQVSECGMQSVMILIRHSRICMYCVRHVICARY